MESSPYIDILDSSRNDTLEWLLWVLEYIHTGIDQIVRICAPFGIYTH